MAVPVYVITGFLESGKTTLIKDTMTSEGFYEGEKTVLFLCENGMEGYTEQFCKDYKTHIIKISKKEQLTTELFQKVEEHFQPDRIFIEYNGMWSVSELMNMELPEFWVFAQVISTVDASTFTMYINNMRSVIYEQLLHSELIICNRCDENVKKSFLRGNIKAINKIAQIIYEGRDGKAQEFTDADLPFDLTQDELYINDDDYGLWYMDMLDHPKKYHNKTVHVKGMVIKKSGVGKNAFILGRQAMVCCADDLSTVGLLCESRLAPTFLEGQWLQVEAQVHVQYDPEYNDDMAVLIAKNIEKCDPMEDPLVYFS